MTRPDASLPIPPDVARVLDGYPAAARTYALALRALIHAVADATPGVGPVQETLKWGEPAFLTPGSRSGSTIRLAWKSAAPERLGVYFNCKTTLIDQFRHQFGDALAFEGNRAILLRLQDPVPNAVLGLCFGMALTYHRRKPGPEA